MQRIESKYDIFIKLIVKTEAVAALDQAMK
jgi:hypothetical protein